MVVEHPELNMGTVIHGSRGRHVEVWLTERLGIGSE